MWWTRQANSTPGTARWGLLVALGMLAYLIAMVVTLPARTALAWAGLSHAVTDVTGTVWSAQAAVADRVAIDWTSAPLHSLLNFTPSGDVHMRGPETDLAAAAIFRRGGLRLERVRGGAGGALLAALAPTAPMQCVFVAVVDFDHITLGGAEQGFAGTARTGPANCNARGTSTPVALPPLVVTARRDGEASRADIVDRDRRTVPLLQLSLTAAGRLRLSVTPAGAAMLPAGAGAGMSLETQL